MKSSYNKFTFWLAHHVPQTDYYRRYQNDGSCEIICTQCFSTVGTALNARSAEAIEAGHSCSNKTNRAGAVETANPGANRSATLTARKSVRQFPEVFPRNRMYLPIAAFAAVFLCYALPTVAELIALHHVNLWFACILPGDLAGCICIGAVFKMPRTGALLYLLLTLLEGYLHVAHLLAAGAFVWIVDLVPTLTVIGILVYTTIASDARSFSLESNHGPK
jgi:hypothetical protein